MNQDAPSIAQILIAPSRLLVEGSVGPLSIGILSSSGEAFWGDCLSNHILAEQLPTVERLVDLVLSRSRDQHLSSFRALWDSIRSIFPDSGRVQVADEVAAAVQQALLTAVSSVQHCTVVELLSSEYGRPDLNTDCYDCPAILEISDYTATAERIDRMIALRPAGIGYRLTNNRVAESLGENAEYLERFVAELSQRVGHLNEDAAHRPTLYLGLNGALGQLAGDPVRYIGKVLEISVNLQVAAGVNRLVLEDPFLLDGLTEQSSNLLRLKNLIRVTPTSHGRDEPTQLVARNRFLDREAVATCANIQPVHAMMYELTAMGDIDALMASLAELGEAHIDSFIRIDGQATPRWVKSAVDIAMASRSTGLIVDFTNGAEFLYHQVIRQMSETTTLLRQAPQ